MNIVDFLNQPVWGGIKWTLALEKRLNDPKYLESYGYKVYSQNDEDGIIQEILHRIGVEWRTFVEFGVDKGIESNCHSLLLQGWRGLWIEGNRDAVEQILRRFSPAIASGQLTVKNTFITRDNIDGVLADYAEQDGIDLLSIDIDGNDWHIWNAITTILPRIVVIEYNGKLAPEIDWKMAYNEDHCWDRSDRCNASLTALEKLGRSKGYQLVGTNISGINAFFVRKDLAKDRFALPATAENLYNPARMNLLVHHNGHPSRNYIGNEKEGMKGVFDYYPDWDSIWSFGFYPIEKRNGIRWNLMRDTKARLFIRRIPAESNTVRLAYESAVAPKLLGGLKVTVSIKGKNFVQDILKETGYIDIPLDFSHTPDEILPVDLELNRDLWMPNKNVSYDQRMQGLAIRLAGYQ